MLKVLIFILSLYGLGFAFSASPAYAACPPAGTQVANAPSNHQYTGRDCSGLAEAQTNANEVCIGSTGNRYWVFYCATNNCLAKYDEQGPNAPTMCNRPDRGEVTSLGRVFGEISAPAFIQKFGFGAWGISKFLSNLVTLIYSLAAVVFLFMMLWGAFEWLTSGGDKEKIAAARNRIINAIIGIILFAIAFAIIQILGIFTGWSFFGGQKFVT